MESRHEVLPFYHLYVVAGVVCNSKFFVNMIQNPKGVDLIICPMGLCYITCFYTPSVMEAPLTFESSVWGWASVVMTATTK